MSDPEGERRKVWTTGRGTTVISLPLNLAKRLKKEEVSEFDLYDKENYILLKPIRAEKETIGQITIDEPAPWKASNALISAYLANYDGLEIELKEPYLNVIEKLEKSSHKLYGTTMERESVKKYYFQISPPVESITTLIKKSYNFFTQLHDVNVDAINEKLNFDDKVTQQFVENMEDSMDRHSFYVKRILVSSLVNQEKMDSFGIKHCSEIIHYNTIINTVERMTDLQEELFETLPHLYTKKKGIKKILSGPSDLSIYDYYLEAKKYSDDSFKSHDDLLVMYNQIRSKREQGGLYFGAYNDDSEFVKYIMKQEDVCYYLGLVFGKIKGIIGLASNIAECNANMDRPKLKDLSDS